MTQLNRNGTRGVACGLVFALLLPAQADAPKSPDRKGTAATAGVPTVLQYDFTPGHAHRYKVTAIFTGHIPPFAQPGSKPVNLRADLTYVASVKKVSDKGAEMDFAVDAAELTLLEKDPGDNAKPDPNNEVPFPLPLSQVQQALNVSATLRPDGSVANVSGGSSQPVRLDVGFDLRKLFLLMMPVTFSAKPVTIKSTWDYTDGLLGSREGKIKYTGRLIQVTPRGKALVYQLGEDAVSNIEAMQDKDGKPTDDAKNAADSTTGTVTVGGTMQFVTPAASKTTAQHVGLLSEGRLTLNALLTRKRLVPDPDNPDAPKETQIDVKARLHVRADDSTNASPSARPTKGKTSPHRASGAKGKKKDTKKS